MGDRIEPQVRIGNLGAAVIGGTAGQSPNPGE